MAKSKEDMQREIAVLKAQIASKKQQDALKQANSRTHLHHSHHSHHGAQRGHWRGHGAFRGRGSYGVHRFTPYPQATPASNAIPLSHYLNINDVSFEISEGGSKLVARLGPEHTIQDVPEEATVAGKKFIKAWDGNLYREDRPPPKSVEKVTELCQHFTSIGSCPKGRYCRYVHDPTKVAICKEYLAKGTCALGDECDLSHVPTPNRSPTCLHFLRGSCTNDECRYSHVNVSPKAPVCHHFARLGYCEKGATCSDKHVFECPEYSNQGMCNVPHCRLPHIDRAGMLRKKVASVTQGASDSDATATTESDTLAAVDEADDASMPESEFEQGFSQQADFVPL